MPASKIYMIDSYCSCTNVTCWYYILCIMEQDWHNLDCILWRIICCYVAISAVHVHVLISSLVGYKRFQVLTGIITSTLNCFLMHFVDNKWKYKYNKKALAYAFCLICILWYILISVLCLRCLSSGYWTWWLIFKLKLSTQRCVWDWIFLRADIEHQEYKYSNRWENRWSKIDTHGVKLTPME